MNRVSLAQCIANASVIRFGAVPLVVPQNRVFTVSGFGYSYPVTNSHPSKICVVGHSGLAIDTVFEDWDGKFPAPTLIQ
jgi:hypothetical protein